MAYDTELEVIQPGLHKETTLFHWSMSIVSDLSKKMPTKRKLCNFNGRSFPSAYEYNGTWHTMVCGMMWKPFSMGREPVKKTSEKLTEGYRRQRDR
jgi:hypothetical protein